MQDLIYSMFFYAFGTQKIHGIGLQFIAGSVPPRLFTELLSVMTDVTPITTHHYTRAHLILWQDWGVTSLHFAHYKATGTNGMTCDLL